MSNLKKALMGMTKGELVSLVGMFLVIVDQSMELMGGNLPGATEEKVLALAGSLAGLWVLIRVMIAGKQREDEKEISE